jgi:NAD(P)H-dependent FMN reductase
MMKADSNVPIAVNASQFSTALSSRLFFVSPLEGYDTRMLRLETIVASTRPGRAGLPIGRWFHEAAERHPAFEARFVDLCEVDLPFIDEPRHPRLQQYQHAHTKEWSAIVAWADAYVIVTPEYNYAPPPSLINALDLLYTEWNYKPVGFVSYGGLSGGTRAVQIAKQIVTALKMMPMVEAVHIPFFNERMENNERFTAADVHETAATNMLDELARWAYALSTLRVPV